MPAQGANASSTTDFEQLGYDAASNVTSRRLRNGNSIAFTYDNLGRISLKDLPGSDPDVTYGYDNLGRMTSASQTGFALSFTYDALSRNLTQVSPQGTATSVYDLAGRRTQLTYPGSGLFVNTDYLVTGETVKIRENGATSGVGVLATYGYDDLGRRTSLTFGNGVVQSFGYDPVSRLASLTNDLASTANDLSATFAYNPASQITSNVRTGDAYAWTGHFNENETGTPNGLNQLTAVGAKTLTHDTKGNVTAFGTKSFTYSSENLLLTGPGSTTLSYDGLMRLRRVVAGGATTNMVYDGLDRIAEYSSSVVQRRYVHGPGIDDPIVWYEGSGTTDRRFLSADERRSIMSVTDSAGTNLGTNRYDEFGQPQSTNVGVWGYTGQAWLPTVSAWYYKARIYEPELGRLLQPDPIGYADSPNLYTYVLNDPTNLTDPLGLECGFVNYSDDEITIYAPCNSVGSGGGGAGSGASAAQARLEKRRDYRPRAITVASPRRRLSTCWIKFLNKNAPGFDWGSAAISSDLPAFGSDASTALGTMYAGFYYNNIEQHTSFFLHELGHLPQWASGSLTRWSYALAALRSTAAFSRGRTNSIHDSIPFEQAADAFAERLQNAYNKAGRPCG